MPNDDQPVRLSSGRPTTPDHSYSPAEGSAIPAPASRPPSNTGIETLPTAGELRIPSAQAPSSIRGRGQAARSLSPARSDGSEPTELKFSWLGRPPTPTVQMLGHDGGDDGDDSRGGNAPPSTSSRAAAAATAATSSPSDQRRLVAIALDRMGAAVVEVRDAFQRWVLPDGQAVTVARSTASPTRRSKSRRAVSFSDQEMAAGSSLGIKSSLSTSKEAMMRALAELRLPLKTAERFCDGAGGGEESGTVTFSDFVGRYAAASGLVKETVPPGKRGGGEVWVEGSGGVWVAVPFKKCLHARKIFDGEVAKGTGDRDTGSNSDDDGKTKSIAVGVASVVRPKRVEDPCGCPLG